MEQLEGKIEAIKFEKIHASLLEVSLPAGEQVWHGTMVLSYAEKFEQAR